MADDSGGYSDWSDFASGDTYGGPNWPQSQAGDPNSPLWGNPGWITPDEGGASSGGGDLNKVWQMLGNPDGSVSPSSANPTYPGYPPSQPSGERGSPYSTYTNQWGGSGDSSGIPQPNPRGTMPSPARSNSASYPMIPAPNLGSPSSAMMDRIKNLLSNPDALKSDPIYKFLLDQGMQGFNRSAAAKGMRLSGNTLLGAGNYAENLAMKYLQDMISGTLLPASEQELKQWATPAQLEVQKYGASHGSFGNTVGADPGTGGEYAARDLIPLFQRYLSNPNGGVAVAPGSPAVPTGPGFGGLTLPDSNTLTWGGRMLSDASPVRY